MPNDAREQANFETIRRYFDVINTRGTEDTFDEFLDPGIVQDEYPNRLLPAGARRTLSEIREASARGRALMGSQRFEVHRMFASGDTVIVESVWTGTVKADAGPFTAGTTLRARFAQFFELRGGCIVAIRNYDCFDAW